MVKTSDGTKNNIVTLSRQKYQTDVKCTRQNLVNKIFRNQANVEKEDAKAGTVTTDNFPSFFIRKCRLPSNDFDSLK